jgi:hypothetical protein
MKASPTKAQLEALNAENISSQSLRDQRISEEPMQTNQTEILKTIKEDKQSKVKESMEVDKQIESKMSTPTKREANLNNTQSINNSEITDKNTIDFLEKLLQIKFEILNDTKNEFEQLNNESKHIVYLSNYNYHNSHITFEDIIQLALTNIIQDFCSPTNQSILKSKTRSWDLNVLESYPFGEFDQKSNESISIKYLIDLYNRVNQKYKHNQLSQSITNELKLQSVRFTIFILNGLFNANFNWTLIHSELTFFLFSKYVPSDFISDLINEISNQPEMIVLPENNELIPFNNPLATVICVFLFLFCLII